VTIDPHAPAAATSCRTPKVPSPVPAKIERTAGGTPTATLPSPVTSAAARPLATNPPPMGNVPPALKLPPPLPSAMVTPPF
jgi:hypothetical protein